MERTGERSRRFSAGAMQRRPALTCAGVFIAGVALHTQIAGAPIVWICLAIGCALVAILVDRRRAGASCLLLACGLFCCAIASAKIEAFYFPRDDIGNYSTGQRRLARVELEFDQPLRVLSSPSSHRPMPPRQVTTARVLRVFTSHGWSKAQGHLLVQIEPPNQRLKLGQRVRAMGMLQRPQGALNPGQFDWSAYYRAQRLLASLTIPHSDAIEILGDARPSLLGRARLAVRGLLGKGFTSAQSLDHALLRALVLGDNDPELSDVREQFRRTGTSHHLAISGMHVAILGFVVFLICRLLLLRARPSAIIAVSFVIAYGAVALPSPPVLRSVIVWVAVSVAILSGRRSDALHLLAVSVLAILVFNPLDLFDAGFQLSFGTVLWLLLLSGKTMSLLRDPDAEVAIFTPGGRPPRRLIFMHWARTWMGRVVLSGVIAWVGSMPLIAFHFSQLNPWAVLASFLLAIPVTLSLIGGFLKIILTALCPWGAHVWAIGAALPVMLMRHGVDWLARLPGSDVPLPAHSILFIILYYGLVLLFLAPVARPALRRITRLGPLYAVMLLVLIPLSGGAGARLGSDLLRVTVLSVGAGQCCVMELPDGRVILLDAGSNTLTDPVRKCIVPFLRSRGRFQVDEIWLADSDYDHIGAAKEMMEQFGVKRIVTGDAWHRHASATATGEALIESIQRDGVTIKTLHEGDRVPLGSGASAEVLWPRPVEPLVMNNSDLVLKITYARRTILFPSDVQKLAQLELLKHPQELHCDVMLAPHHGSGEDSTPDFINAADPLYIISSNDNTLTQKQIRFEHQTGGRPLFRTNTCGAVTILIDRHGGLTVTPFVQRQNQ
jgi:competence protein ComEC